MTRALAILALLALVGCGGSTPPPQGPPTPSLDASKWEFRYGNNFAGRPQAVAGGGFTFVFPASPAEIHYLTTDVTMKASVHASITLEIEAVSGSPEFRAHNNNPTPCDRPAFVRIMLEQRGDEKLTNEFGRWWAQLGYELKPGTVTMDVPLDLGAWSSVYGKYGVDAPGQFRAAMANLGKVGVTFGGCGNYGHGASTVNGSARMTVTAFSVQ